MLSMFPLLGFGLGPVLATQMEAMTGSWRQVFYFAALPGLAVAALLFFVLKEPVELGLPVRERPASAGRGALGADRVGLAAGRRWLPRSSDQECRASFSACSRSPWS